MFHITIQQDKPKGRRYALLMYTGKDYLLSSRSTVSDKQAKINVLKRYRFRKKGNLFLQHVLSEHFREHIRTSER